jgi:hypothetical protein
LKFGQIARNLCKFANYVGLQACEATFQYLLRDCLVNKHLHLLKYLLINNMEMDRKRLTELTINDLLENEVWEYWMADNEEYVRASDKTVIAEDSNIAYIVATDFVFKNRSKHLGFCSPQEAASLDRIQPVIITSKGQIEFYKESDWTEDEVNNALSGFGLNWQNVFPIVYTTRIKYNREVFTGTLTDFNENK